MNIASLVPQVIFFVCLAIAIGIVIRRFPNTKKEEMMKRKSERLFGEKGAKKRFQEKATILKKQSGEWMKTLKIKKNKPKEEIDMNAHSNIQSLNQTEQKTEEPTTKAMHSPKKDEPQEEEQPRIKERKRKQWKYATLFSKKKLPEDEQIEEKEEQPIQEQPAIKRFEETTPPISKETQEPEARQQSKQYDMIEKPQQQIMQKAPQSISIQRTNKPAPRTILNPEKLLNKEKEYLAKIVTNPKDIQSFKELAEVYIQQGNVADAIHSLEEVLKLSPNDLISEEKLLELRQQ